MTSFEEDVWNMSLMKLSSIIAQIEDSYYEEVDPEELSFASIKGMLQTLDPHSNFLDPRGVEFLREESGGKYYGLGILIQKHHTRLVVISPLEGTPASRLGIRSGDVISHINGESTEPISSYEAMQKLRGPKGTTVTITISREEMEESFDLDIERAEIPLHSVPYAFILKEDAGYIFIRNFASTTTSEFIQKLEYLSEQGMKKLILDLRRNGGGMFAPSIEISDIFLQRGKSIVSVKGRQSYYNREFRAFQTNDYEDIPLIILIDDGTASASEIVSGAVKDNDRGLIIGEDSFGKGLVQTVFPLAENAAVALTTAKYLTPSGRSIQRDFSRLEDYVFFRNDLPEEDREVTYTSSGRKVLGQGGISPDYDIQSSFKPLTYNLLFKGAFFSYVRAFTDRKTPLSKKAVFPEKDDSGLSKTEGALLISKATVIDDRFLEDFVQFIKKKKFEFTQEQYNEARSEIIRELEKEIFSSFWGIEEGQRVYRLSDPVVLKAFEVFPEAEALVK
jgi:carboxyl-terminal processing protease